MLKWQDAVAAGRFHDINAHMPAVGRVVTKVDAVVETQQKCVRVSETAVSILAHTSKKSKSQFSDDPGTFFSDQ
jgi:hypothetical protein